VNRGVVALAFLGGRLAAALAATDPDVDAGVAAHQEGRFAEAVTHYDAAIQRRGERAELAFDRGIALAAKGERENARVALQRGTEAQEANIAASAFFGLGNLAFDEEDYDTAIADYVDCLKRVPEHEGAKWNLELALQRREEKRKQDEEKQDEEKQDEEKQDEEKQDEEKQDEEKQDEEKQDSGSQEPDPKDPEDSGRPEGEGREQEVPKDPPADDSKEEPQERGAPPPREIDRADLERALQQLDAEDDFRLARPRGGTRPPEKDW
jgi:Ca-activated chloride channel family protein